MALELVDGGSPPAPLTLDLWLWRLDVGPDHVATLADHLDPVERDRAGSYARAEDGRLFTVARGRMREVLGGYIGLAPAHVPLRRGAHGQPLLAEGPHGAGPSFNLSHAGGWAALVVGPHAVPLGIDIEPHRPIDRDVPERFFSPAERAELAALEGDAWQAGFFNGWTRKEALLKALGSGMTRPLTSFDVTLTPGAPARLTRLTGARPERWQLVPISLGPDFPGCIAIRETAPVEITVREGALPLPQD